MGRYYITNINTNDGGLQEVMDDLLHLGDHISMPSDATCIFNFESMIATRFVSIYDLSVRNKNQLTFLMSHDTGVLFNDSLPPTRERSDLSNIPDRSIISWRGLGDLSVRTIV